MKHLLGSLLLTATLLNFKANATNYYFSSSSGDDSRSSSQAQNSSTPWKSISKLNSFSGSLRAGDVVYFLRGDTFYGTIQLATSGSSSAPITFSAYGSGSANPVITAFTTVNTWTSLGGNIWESSSSISSLNTANMVVLNNTPLQIGRWPNSGYRTVSSHSGSGQITDKTLSGSPNWTGGEVVIKKARWIIDRNVITSQSGGTINFTSGSSYAPTDGFGYFIQNNANTLDVQNEWYYNPSTKKIRMYSTTKPVNVQVSTAEYVVYLVGRSYITFTGLTFTGGNTAGFYVGASQHLTITNSNIYFCKNGFFGVNWGSSSAYLNMKNNSINFSNNNAVVLTSEFSNAYVGYNTIKNTAMIPGMGDSGDGTYMAVKSNCNTATIERNEIDNTGYSAISFDGTSVNILNNLINGFASIKDDGGGIYTDYEATGRVISGNIVLNGFGSAAGTNSTTVLRAHGIYLDGNVSGNVQITNNTVASVSWGGIFIHNPHDVVVTGNTCFDAPIGFLVKNDRSSAPIRHLTVTGNVFVGKTSSQLAADYVTLLNDVKSFGTFDNNTYARPMADNTTITVSPQGDSGPETHDNLSQWKSYVAQESHSKQSPRSVTSVNSIRFEYNWSSSSKSISLGTAYLDMKGLSLPTSLTLAPFSSSVMVLSSGGTTAAAVNTAEIAEVNTPLSKAAFVINPNPVADVMAVDINNENTGKMNLQIVNETGAVVRSMNLNKDQQNAHLDIPASGLPTGVYFVHVQVGNWTETKKMVKQ